MSEGVNVGFHVYGHEGTTPEEAGRELRQSSSCRVRGNDVDTPALTEQVEALQPVGWTPLSFSWKP